MKTSKLMTLLVMAGALLNSCSDDDYIPKIVNQEEVITTMNVTLIDPSGSIITLKSYDSDGDGPNAPVVTVSGSLSTNTIYSGEVELLNETVFPVENITLEVMKEADEHQFFFVKSDALNASFDYSDTEADYKKDDNSMDPVGIAFTLSTAEASSGTVSVTLIHEPEKGASGVSQGNIANAGGETDFTATFPVIVQ